MPTLNRFSAIPLIEIIHPITTHKIRRCNTQYKPYRTLYKLISIHAYIK